MLLLPARAQSTLDVAARHAAAPAFVSDSRRRRGQHPSIAAVIRAKVWAMLDAIPDTDFPAQVYQPSRKLPVRRSATEWTADAPLIPVSAMVIEHPSVWHSSHMQTDKRMVYAERNGIPVQPRTGTDALHMAASKLPQRKTAKERQDEIFGRAQDAFWEGFNKSKERHHAGL